MHMMMMIAIIPPNVPPTIAPIFMLSLLPLLLLPLFPLLAVGLSVQMMYL